MSRHDDRPDKRQRWAILGFAVAVLALSAVLHSDYSSWS